MVIDSVCVGACHCITFCRSLPIRVSSRNITSRICAASAGHNTLCRSTFFSASIAICFSNGLSVIRCYLSYKRTSVVSLDKLFSTFRTSCRNDTCRNSTKNTHFSTTSFTYLINNFSHFLFHSITIPFICRLVCAVRVFLAR